MTEPKMQMVCNKPLYSTRGLAQIRDLGPNTTDTMPTPSCRGEEFHKNISSFFTNISYAYET